MRKWIFWAAGLVALVLILVPQMRSYSAMGERRFAVLERSQNELLVGVSWPFAMRSDGMANGLALARDRINAEGLAGGHTVRLILRDDEDDWDAAQGIVREFADNPHMSAVVGYDDDSVGIRASPIYEAAQLLQICVNTNSPAMTQHGYKYIVRTVPSTDKIARFLAEESVRRNMGRRFAMVWDDDAYGKDLIYQYRIAEDGYGAHMVYQWSVQAENADYRMAVNQLKMLNADWILFWGSDENIVRFLKSARGVGLKTRIVVASDLTSNLFRDAGPAIDGVYFLSLYDSAAKTPENIDFVKRYRKRFGYDPDTSAAQGYDALLLLARAARATKSVNPLDLSYGIRFMPQWWGANGAYRFDEKGELMDKPLHLVVARAAAAK